MSRSDNLNLSRRVKEVRNYKILKSLQGKCIPKLICYGYHTNGQHYLGISDLGGSTAKWSMLTAEEGALIAEAMKQVHALGIAHRSLYPRNVIIDKEGKPWLIDFDNSIEHKGDPISSQASITHYPINNIFSIKETH